MELIDGPNLSFHAARADLSVRDRVALLAQICDAVEHAAQRGIVHRDLKPANILIDGRGQPKVLDFGIARLERTESADTVLQTRVGQVVGTLAYMSPEQAAGQREAIDARSDVYALGVIAYELLAGRAPYELAGLPLTRAIRTINDQEAPALGAMRRELRGDLTVIVQQALEKEPDRRYPSAGELGADLRRYLDEQPIAAKPATAAYRLQKFARRNRGAVTWAAVTAVVLLAGVVMTVLEAAATRRALDKYELLESVITLEQTIAEEAELFPEAPEVAPRMRTWLRDRAEKLVAALPELRSVLRGVRERALDDSEADRAADRSREPTASELERARRDLATLEAELSAYDSRSSEAPGLPGLELVGRARALRAPQREVLRQRITELEEILATRQAYSFSQPADQFLHDQLAALVRGIEEIRRPDGLVSRVRTRLAWAESVDEETRGAPEWGPCVAAIRDDPRFRGLELSPQRGLVPLGADPESGLWEFHHPRSGAAPQRDPRTRRWRVAADTGMVFVLLPGGRTPMGSQRQDNDGMRYDPAAEANDRVTELELDAFFVSKYELTRGQWVRLTGGPDPCPNPIGAIAGDHVMTAANPVVHLDWHDSVRCLRRVDLQLPTEAQWEYACRAGTSTPWWTGAEPTTLQGAANLADQSGARQVPWKIETWLSDGHVMTAPVGSFAPESLRPPRHARQRVGVVPGRSGRGRSDAAGRWLPGRNVRCDFLGPRRCHEHARRLPPAARTRSIDEARTGARTWGCDRLDRCNPSEASSADCGVRCLTRFSRNRLMVAVPRKRCQTPYLLVRQRHAHLWNQRQAKWVADLRHNLGVRVDHEMRVVELQPLQRSGPAGRDREGRLGATDAVEDSGERHQRGREGGLRGERGVGVQVERHRESLQREARRGAAGRTQHDVGLTGVVHAWRHPHHELPARSAERPPASSVERGPRHWCSAGRRGAGTERRRRRNACRRGRVAWGRRRRCTARRRSGGNPRRPCLCTSGRCRSCRCRRSRPRYRSTWPWRRTRRLQSCRRQSN